MSTFVVTAYCEGSYCNGKLAGQTSSGATPREGTTCAAGKQYPFENRIKLDGIGTFVVEDRGGSITVNKIDIYMKSHSRENNFGRSTVKGRVIN